MNKQLSKLMKEFNECKDLISEGYKALDKEVSISLPGPCMPAISDAKDTGIGSPYGGGAKRFKDFFFVIGEKISLGPKGRTFASKHAPYGSTEGYNPFFVPLEQLTTKKYGELLSKDTLNKIYKTKKESELINFQTVEDSYNLALEEAFINYKQKLAKKDKFAIGMKKDIKDFCKTNKFELLDAMYYGVLSKKNNTRDSKMWDKKDLELYKTIANSEDKSTLLSGEYAAEIEGYIFQEYLSYKFSANDNYSYISDLQVAIPESIICAHKNLFLDIFTLGSPPDIYSDKPRNWGFSVFNPNHIFTKNGSLGKGGKILYEIFDNIFSISKGGVRIDHYIGFVNPYLISNKKGVKSGRSYSSYKHSILLKYSKKTVEEFSNITNNIILKAAKDNGLTSKDIYIEDLGNRPEQLDDVIEHCGLGKMAVSQFVDIDDADHMYRLKNTHENDFAVLDTHDSDSIFNFYEDMEEAEKVKHLKVLSEDLRWDYNKDLLSVECLVRMKWAELFMCPATRVQAFFTSFIGQDGRYNKPGYPIKWVLRMNNNFEEKYFANLAKGLAYNPFDAISLAIYARGDEFYAKNEDLVSRLREKEKVILSLANSIF